jgi:hypothetical protein
VEDGAERAERGTRGDEVGVGCRGRSGAFGGHRKGGKEEEEEEEEKHGAGNV